MAKLSDFVDIGNSQIHELTPDFENQLWKAADKLRRKVEGTSIQIHSSLTNLFALSFLRFR